MRLSSPYNHEPVPPPPTPEFPSNNYYYYSLFIILYAFKYFPSFSRGALFFSLCCVRAGHSWCTQNILCSAPHARTTTTMSGRPSALVVCIYIYFSLLGKDPPNRHSHYIVPLRSQNYLKRLFLFSLLCCLSLSLSLYRVAGRAEW